MEKTRAVIAKDEMVKTRTPGFRLICGGRPLNGILMS